MRNILALIIFVILQILFIPLAVIGAILVAYKQLIVSKNLGVSQTAIEIINGRWTMHIFGLRDDPAAARLNPVLPNNSTFGLWLVLFPLYVYYRISGATRWYPVIAEAGEEGLAQLVLNRTVYFDSIIGRASSDAEQFVLMGAGLDTRAYNDLKHSGMEIFELDQPRTQRYKRKYLAQAGIDTAHVTFVESDFSQDSWYSALLQAGYDPSKRTIFLWEGVTLYLTEKSVRKTLRTMRDNSVEGSVLVADFYARSFVSGDYAAGLKASLPILDTTDEQLAFGIEMADEYQHALQSFIRSEELVLGARYFMGYKSKKGPWMVVAEIKL